MKKIKGVVLCLLLLFPFYLAGEGDGGTTHIAAIAWQVTFHHSFLLEGEGYLTGLTVRIFGIPVYERLEEERW